MSVAMPDMEQFRPLRMVIFEPIRPRNSRARQRAFRPNLLPGVPQESGGRLLNHQELMQRDPAS